MGTESITDEIARISQQIASLELLRLEKAEAAFNQGVTLRRIAAATGMTEAGVRKAVERELGRPLSAENRGR